ncbi:MAG: beta-galactosidase [Dysgonamonadaceae bacterium]|jgi:beta-galactosidase/beta-glucuronidase|nr:beta-galactosidase [Dysgonamonadaceae bacterium]
MKKNLFIYVFIAVATSVNAQWKPAGDKIKTQWAEKVNPQNVLPEYPRPILERPEWMNLNGLWNFAVTSLQDAKPATYEGRILVPFAVESSLSGVQQAVSDKQQMWYNRTFTIPKQWKNKRILLHFGAVDWKTEVFVNDVLIGSHTGGYAPFSFDITPFLVPGEKQELTVKVWDPTDKYFQPHGKQVSAPANIVYTAVSGIWQTVWLEPVAEKHISSLKILPDIDKSIVLVNVKACNASQGDYAEIKILKEGKLVSVKKAALSDNAIEIPVPDAQLWSPDSPFLYDIEISLFSKGVQTDKVKSYCGMRKISIARDNKGVLRLQLNNKNLFNLGVLDQGWYPDGLYTAATDEALVSDILMLKNLGFNMIRKHVKVEPARWYTHCDRLGILVWQDMPSGDNNWGYNGINYMRDYLDDEVPKKNEKARDNYRKEWKEIIDNLYSYPSIVMWIPFNEGWGQFDTADIAEWTKSYDPSRILNPASGGNFYHTGDVLDLHNYPEPKMFLYDAARVNVLGEYGGIGYAVNNHLWSPDDNFGYESLLKSPKEVTDKYIRLLNILKSLDKFSGSVYTQVSDVEHEVNGLVTYDRKVIKIDEVAVRKANQDIIRQFSE